MKPIISFLLSFSITITASAQWSEIGRSLAWPICADISGNVYAAGKWTGDIPYTNKLYVAKWNGTSWVPLDSANFRFPGSSALNDMCVDSLNNVYTAGRITNSSGRYVAKWSGTNWSEVGAGSNHLAANNDINSLCVDRAGNLYAAGQFTNSNGKYYVAKWDGVTWSELGSGINSIAANDIIETICTDNAGNIYAAGYFKNTNGYNYVAKWDGVNWSELASGTDSLNADGPIYSLCADKAGNIYTSTYSFSLNKNYVAKWNGTNWGEVGAAANDTLDNGSIRIKCLAADPMGNIYAATGKSRPQYPYGYYYLIRWDGNRWSEPGGTNSLKTNNDNNLCLDRQGNLYATSGYNIAGNYDYIAKYTGAYNATFTTAQDGDWNSPATWANGMVPYNGAIIIVRHNVNVNTNAICYSVTMQPGGNITVASGLLFTVLH